MAIRTNPLDRRGVTRAGDRWKIMPIVEEDLNTVYWDLSGTTGANKTETTPK
jgi:hypothetical protein